MWTFSRTHFFNLAVPGNDHPNAVAITGCAEDGEVLVNQPLTCECFRVDGAYTSQILVMDEPDENGKSRWKATAGTEVYFISSDTSAGWVVDTKRNGVYYYQAVEENAAGDGPTPDMDDWAEKSFNNLSVNTVRLSLTCTECPGGLKKCSDVIKMFQKDEDPERVLEACNTATLENGKGCKGKEKKKNKVQCKNAKTKAKVEDCSSETSEQKCLRKASCQPVYDLGVFKECGPL